MKPEDVNRLIAEKCGWEYIITSVEGISYGVVPAGSAGESPFRKLPDYYHDLNAVHDAEAWLDDKDVDTKSLYWDHLCLVCWPEEAEGSDTFIRDYAVCRSTAQQRCEALLRVWGLWKEEE